MPSDEPIARLPDSVQLDLQEVAIVLGALDRGADAVEPGSDNYEVIRRATRLITAKLWPELGAYLDDEEEQ